MPRVKKDGRYINYYIDRKIYDKLDAYAKHKGQTATMALERILEKFFNEEGCSLDDVNYSMGGKE